MLKKKNNVFAMVLVAIMMVATIVYAADFTTALKADNTNLKPGDTVKVTLTISNLGEEGVNAVTGTLEYDKTIFETLQASSFVGKNSWSMTGYEDSKGKFILENNNLIKETQDIAEITLKVKADATDKTIDIAVKELTAGGVNQEIASSGAKVSITVKKENNDNTENTQTNTNTPNVQTNTQTNVTINVTTNTATNTNIQQSVNKTANVTTNSQNKANNTNTTADTKIPHAGENDFILFIVITVLVIVGIVSYIRYKKVNDK